MLPSQFNTETELSAVNSILGSIGQAPITKLEFDNPEVSFVYQLLQECNTDVQAEGWAFNTENHYELTPDSNDYIQVPANILQMDVSEGQIYRDTDIVKRNGRLYDKLNHTDIFTSPVHVDIVWKFNFTDLPQIFKRYITYRASVRAATQLVGNKELAQMLSVQEAFSRAGCMEYECNQGDYTYFGTPPETSYRSYQPYMSLNRL